MRDYSGALVRTVLAVIVLVAGVASLAALAGVPYAAEHPGDAVIRLAWRARGERGQRCRRLSPDELAKLPVHMRQEEVCERGMLPYHLRVAIDGRTMVDQEVRAGGAQSDRPLFVFQELPVPPGEHRVTITFERAESHDDKNRGQADEESDDRELRDLRATPRRLTLDETVTLAARAIVLVTYDDERRRLRLLAGPPFDP
jgi:hypothetical protein